MYAYYIYIYATPPWIHRFVCWMSFKWQQMTESAIGDEETETRKLRCMTGFAETVFLTGEATDRLGII